MGKIEEKDMQQLKNIEDIEIALNEYGEIVMKKDNKNNVMIMSMEEYKEQIMREDIIKKLKKSEEEIEKGEGIPAEILFKELRQKYGY